MEFYKNLSLELLSGYDDDGNFHVEEFKDIPDYEGLYQASTFGRVKRLPKIMKEKARKRVGIYKEKILRAQIIKNKGYLHVALSKNGKVKRRLVHRIVGSIFIPNLENKPQINHIDLIKINCMFWNLEWMTERENQEHYQNSIITASRYVGVSYITNNNPPRKKRWIAIVTIKGIRYHLGYFLTEIEAYTARQNKLKELN